MSKPASPPWARGKTYSGSATPGSTDGAAHLGREFVFDDFDYSLANAVKPVRSQRPVTVRVVRNSCVVNSGGEITTGALLPKRLTHFKANSYNIEVDGYSAVTADGPTYPVDEYLPAAGVSNLDLFYIVVQGPAMCLTDIAAVDTINYQDALVALTGATSGATTSGRVDQATFAGATAVLAVQIQNSIGRALSAKTSANTNSSILVDIRRSE